MSVSRPHKQASKLITCPNAHDGCRWQAVKGPQPPFPFRNTCRNSRRSGIPSTLMPLKNPSAHTKKCLIPGDAGLPSLSNRGQLGPRPGSDWTAPGICAIAIPVAKDRGGSREGRPDGVLPKVFPQCLAPGLEMNRFFSKLILKPLHWCKTHEDNASGYNDTRPPHPISIWSGQWVQNASGEEDEAAKGKSPLSFPWTGPSAAK